MVEHTTHNRVVRSSTLRTGIFFPTAAFAAFFLFHFRDISFAAPVRFIEMQSILITNSQIHERIAELGKQISQDYVGKDLLLLCVLKGAVVFLADLMRTISIPVRCEFIQLASYNDGTSPSAVKVVQGLTGVLNGADVLIVEDIVDSGHSLNFLIDHIETLKPQSVKVCSLLDKPDRRQVPITVDYLGFEIPDVFVVGYGMDYAQQYRNLPYIKQV